MLYLPYTLQNGGLKLENLQVLLNNLNFFQSLQPEGFCVDLSDTENVLQTLFSPIVNTATNSSNQKL